MRCSTVIGFHGRSNSTRRVQNSKLRPSPPHSVETSIDGPPGRRNWATSISRWPGERSSWNTPTRSCARRLIAVLIASSVSRWATKTSVLSPASRHSRRLAGQPRRSADRSSSAPRASSRSALSRGASTASSAGAGGQGAPDLAGLLRRATALSAGHRAHCRLQLGHAAASRRRRRSSDGRGSAWRQAADVRRAASRWCTAAAARPGSAVSSKSASSGNSSGRSSWSSRKNPCASSSSGVAVSSRTWRPSSAIGWIAR